MNPCSLGSEKSVYYNALQFCERQHPVNRENPSYEGNEKSKDFLHISCIFWDVSTYSILSIFLIDCWQKVHNSTCTEFFTEYWAVVISTKLLLIQHTTEGCYIHPTQWSAMTDEAVGNFQTTWQSLQGQQFIFQYVPLNYIVSTNKKTKMIFLLSNWRLE